MLADRLLTRLLGADVDLKIEAAGQEARATFAVG
jgi:hypothetical protein